MRLVVDASVAIKWVVEEADTEQALSIHRFDLIAPELMFSECCNALWKASHRGKITATDALERIDALHAVILTIVPAQSLAKRALDIALTLDHPAYDALYLAMAERHGTRVVTADVRLLRKLKGTRFASLAMTLQDAAAN